MTGSISSTGNEGSSQPISTPTIQDFTDLDQKIQKKAQGILYHLFGFGAKEVKKLRIERFQLAKDLILSIDSRFLPGKNSLNKISKIMQKEVTRLEKRGGKELLIQDHKALREAILDKTKPSVIGISDLKIAGKEGTREEFQQGNTTNGDFEFSLKTATGDLNLKGAGKTGNRLNAKGGFGRVYFGNKDGRKVAVKVMQVTKKTENAIDREIANFSKIQGGPNVMGAHEVVHINDDKGSLAYVCVVMDNMEGGDLFDRSFESSFGPQDRVKTLGQAAAGLASIHEQGFVHLDVKEDNIFMSKAGAKIGDFGLSSKQENITKDTIRGTDPYMAPEIKENRSRLQEIQSEYKSKVGLEGKTRAEKWGQKQFNKLKTAGPPADIYSFGIMMVKVLGDPNVVQKQSIIKALESPGAYTPPQNLFKHLPEAIRGDVLSIVQDCLKEDPDQRITGQQLVEKIGELERKMG